MRADLLSFYVMPRRVCTTPAMLSSDSAARRSEWGQSLQLFYCRRVRTSGNKRDRVRSGRGILIPAMQFGLTLTNRFLMKPATRLVELLRSSLLKPSGVVSYEGKALRLGASGGWGACGARARAHQSLHHERDCLALLRVARHGVLGSFKRSSAGGLQALASRGGAARA